MLGTGEEWADTGSQAGCVQAGNSPSRQVKVEGGR